MPQEPFLKHGWWIAAAAFLVILLARLPGSDLVQGILTVLAGLIIAVYYGMLASNWQGLRDQLFERHHIRTTRLRVLSLRVGAFLGVIAVAGGLWLLVNAVSG